MERHERESGARSGKGLDHETPNPRSIRTVAHPWEIRIRPDRADNHARISGQTVTVLDLTKDATFAEIGTHVRTRSDIEKKCKNNNNNKN
jgi:hypothetical protein